MCSRSLAFTGGSHCSHWTAPPLFSIRSWNRFRAGGILHLSCCIGLAPGVVVGPAPRPPPQPCQGRKGDATGEKNTQVPDSNAFLLLWGSVEYGPLVSEALGSLSSCKVSPRTVFVFIDRLYSETRGVCVCVCVCVWERERERERAHTHTWMHACFRECVCVCVQTALDMQAGLFQAGLCILTQE